MHISVDYCLMPVAELQDTDQSENLKNHRVQLHAGAEEQRTERYPTNKAHSAVTMHSITYWGQS